MGHCLLRCSLCSVQQVRWSLHWCCDRAGHDVVSGGCGFAGLWRFHEEEAALGNHSAQRPASVRVASPGHDMGHCKTKYSLCSVQSCCGACTGCSGRAGQVACGACSFVAFWSFSVVEEAPLGNHSAQSPGSVRVASLGHVMGHCNIKSSLCSSEQQVWWSLHWVLGPGWAGGLWVLRFCRSLVEFSSRDARQPQCIDPCQCENSQYWAYNGPLQDKM